MHVEVTVKQTVKHATNAIVLTHEPVIGIQSLP